MIGQFLSLLQRVCVCVSEGEKRNYLHCPLVLLETLVEWVSKEEKLLQLWQLLLQCRESVTDGVIEIREIKLQYQLLQLIKALNSVV